MLFSGMFNIYILSIILILLSVSCNGLTWEENLEVKPSLLVGGSNVKTDQILNSVVKIENTNSNCSAAIIGRKALLTAAHCLLDIQTQQDTFKAGDTLNIKYLGSIKRTFRTKITAIHLHDSFIEALEIYETDAHHLPTVFGYDVAIVIIDDNLNSDNALEISEHFIAEQKEVLLVGFGCTEYDRRSSSMFSFPEPDELRSAYSLTTNSSAVEHLLPDYVWNELGQQVFMTPGRKLERKKPSLCEGDSGGPVLIKNENKFMVVGVNSFIYKKKHHKYSYMNFHARINTLAPWIKNILEN